MAGTGWIFGWAKPVPVNPSRLRSPRRDMVLVAAAGPGINLALALISAALLSVLGGFTAEPEFLRKLLTFSIFFNVLIGVFNLIPIPPLDGSKVLFAFLPPRALWQWRPILEQYGFIVLIIVFFLPITPQGAIGGVILVPVLDALYGLLVGV
jgi:Zn-dependent protease